MARLSFYRSSKTKISNFEIVVLVHEQILWFEITVSYLIVVAVLKAVQQLGEVVSCLFLLERSRFGNKVKKTFTSQFEHNVHNLLLLSATLLIDLVAVLVQLDDILVGRDLAHELDLRSD